MMAGLKQFASGVLYPFVPSQESHYKLVEQTKFQFKCFTPMKCRTWENLRSTRSFLRSSNPGTLLTESATEDNTVD
jgi:hypothetical protein